MRNKYKKKRSIEQQKRDNKIANQTPVDSLNYNHSKIFSPDAKTKNNLLLNGNTDFKDNSKNNYDNIINKLNIKTKKNLFSLINPANKNNNIATVSHEFKSKKINNNNKLKIFPNKNSNDYKELKKENKDNKINKENLKETISLNNKNNLKSSAKKINENKIKNNISNDFDSIKKRLYHPSNNKYIKDNIKNDKDINKTNINDENKEITTNDTMINKYNKVDEVKKNEYIYFTNKSEENRRYKNNGIKVNNEMNNNYNNDDNNQIINNNHIIRNDVQKEEYKIINEKNLSTSAPNNSLKDLIHQAHKIHELAESFNKVYIPSQPKINYSKNTYDPRIEKKSYDKNYIHKFNIRVNKKEINQDNNISDISNRKNDSLCTNDNKTETILDNSANNNNIINKYIFDLKRKNIYIIKKKHRNISSDEILQNKENNNIDNEEVDLYENNTIEVNKNNLINYYGGSLSEKKNNYKSFIKKRPENYMSKDNTHKYYINNNSKYSFRSINSYKNINYYDKNIEFESFYSLIAKLQNILELTKNHKKCQNEIFDWITYFYNSNMFNKILNIFISKNNQYSMSKFLKMKMVCIFLCYDAFFHQNFNQKDACVLSLFNKLYNSFLILFIYIIDNNNNNAMNNIFLKNKLRKLLINEENYNRYKSQIKNEVDVLFFINNNFKEINNYYQYIFGTLYSLAYKTILKDKIFLNNIKYAENKNIIPYTFYINVNQNNLTNNQIIGITSLFFYDYYRIPEYYNFDDLYTIFDNFLSQSNYINNNSIYNHNTFLNNYNQIKYRDFSLFKYNAQNQSFLPPIKKCYKYTLVLDLDETLVYCRKDSMNHNKSFSKNQLIMRPGLLEFLHKMKQIYELVLFSLGTCTYVNNIVNIIEKNEKFFEYILYRQHATYNDNIYIKNLSLLGRDLKNIIIVDDIPEVFKLHKNNGICIKPFYGDVVGERNTLKFLGNILQKIRFDAEESGDIRKSLEQHRNLIFTHITTNIESN